MKTFACGAVVPGCTATFRGENAAEILGQVAHHAHHVHGLTEISEDLVAQVRAHIRKS